MADMAVPTINAANATARMKYTLSVYATVNARPTTSTNRNKIHVCLAL
jgi:hypothetical protein